MDFLGGRVCHSPRCKLTTLSSLIARGEELPKKTMLVIMIAEWSATMAVSPTASCPLTSLINCNKKGANAQPTEEETRGHQ
jgi:hypothetical protein